MAVLKHKLLKYEPRLKDVELTLMSQRTPGHLRYTLEAELKQIGLVRFGTEFIPRRAGAGAAFAAEGAGKSAGVG